MKTLVIATNNKGKLKEYKALFHNAHIIALSDLSYNKEIIESGRTFEENALLKAKQVATEVGLPVIADDSGLEVEALKGAPGIYSARYAKDHDDEANNEKLLKELKGVKNRVAQFVCAICLYQPDGTYFLAKEICKGRITTVPAGTNGFGYDPYFFLPELNQTMAQLSLEQKNQVSHRGKAMRKLRDMVYEAAGFE